MDFKFTNNYPISRLDEIVSYLLGPRLWIPNTDYPDFLDWAQKVHGELKKDVKRALIALSENNVVGVAIYQRHKKYKDTLEIKNLTVFEIDAVVEQVRLLGRQPLGDVHVPGCGGDGQEPRVAIQVGNGLAAELDDVAQVGEAANAGLRGHRPAESSMARLLACGKNRA